MFSGSNSYLGGNSGRPGTQQFGTSFNQGQPPASQSNAFNPQQGFAAPLQQQFTGYPGLQAQPTGFQQQQQQQQQMPTPQQQAQYTGYPGQFNNAQAPQQQSFQTGAPPMPPIPQQFQQNQIPPQQFQQSQSTAQPAPIKPQPTGFSQMAASFQTGTASQVKPKGRRASKPATRIPNIRLSFITAQDQAKFETLFKSAVGDGQTLSGDKSRDLLLRSKLDGNSLSQIW